ncbi:MAG: hypothetical protein ACTHLB_11030 [Parafilimonas sp.]
MNREDKIVRGNLKRKVLWETVTCERERLAVAADGYVQPLQVMGAYAVPVFEMVSGFFKMQHLLHAMSAWVHIIGMKLFITEVIIYKLQKH